jgi:hypothetical protein
MKRVIRDLKKGIVPEELNYTCPDSDIFENGENKEEKKEEIKEDSFFPWKKKEEIKEISSQ